MKTSTTNSLLIVGGIAVVLGIGTLLMIGCLLGGYLVGARLVNSDTEDKTQSLIDVEAPDFQLSTITGETLQLSELQSKAVMVNFWASWCNPCVAEMPTLQAFSEKYHQDLIILGVNANESQRDVVGFVEQAGLTFPILLDPGSKVEDLYHIRAFPTSFFIDQEGIVRAVHIGTLSESLLDGYLEQIGVGK